MRKSASKKQVEQREFTIQQVADITAQSTRTIRNDIYRGLLPFKQRPNGPIHILAEDLEAYRTQGRQVGKCTDPERMSTAREAARAKVQRTGKSGRGNAA